MNPPIDDWAGKRVWVIGASTGIGLASAQLMVDLGARVAFSARSMDKLLAATSSAPRAIAVPLDVTDHATVKAAGARIVAEWGGLDLVLVVAGGYNEMRADTFDLQAANDLIDLNLRGVFNCIDVVLPVLLKQGAGALGLVSSVAGYGGLPKALVYGPTKAALINLSECLYFDLQPKGIGVYQINPGFVETPLTAGNDFEMPALMSPEAAAQAIVAGIERGHFHIHFPKRFTNSLRFARLLPYRLYFWLVRKVTKL